MTIVALAPTPLGALVEQVRAGGTEQQQRRLHRTRGDIFDQFEQRVVGPVDIFDDQYQPGRLGERLEKYPPGS